MASIEWLSDNKFTIIVSCGYDKKGKKIRKKKTMTLPDSMKDNQKKKEAQKQAVLFEQTIENGTFLDGAKITFEEFSERFITDYADKKLAPKTIAGYKDYLKRINHAIGHIRLEKLQPHHLNEFYNNLAESGVRFDNRCNLNNKYASLIEEHKEAISTKTGISLDTLKRLANGRNTTYQYAIKISESLKLSVNKLFNVTETSKGLDAKTILHHHRLISVILNKAVKWQVIISNPATRVELPSVKRKEMQCYDEEQVYNMFEILTNEPLKYRAAIYIALYGGLRLGEVTGLEWRDIDFDERILTITKARQYLSGIGTYDKEPKTDRSIRKIKLSIGVISILSEYKKEQSEECFKLGDMWIDSGKVFTQWNGLPMSPQTPSKWFTKWLRSANLPHTTFHGLRHSHASILIANGVDIATVSKRLGHAKISTTLDVYSHAMKSKDNAAADILDNVLSNESEGI